MFEGGNEPSRVKAWKEENEMDSVEPVVRSEDHAKLLDYGLDHKVADRLDEIFSVS